MTPWFNIHNPPPPTDARFESLRKRYVLLEHDETWRGRAWGSALAVVLTVGALLAFMLSPYLQQRLPQASFVVFLFVVIHFVGRVYTHDKRAAQEAKRLWDKLLRRADRCLCPVCHRTLSIDAAGRAPCASCDVTLDRAAWPLTEVPRYEELERISDEAYQDVLELRASSIRRFNAIGALLLLVAISMLIVHYMYPSTRYELLVVVLLIFVMGGALSAFGARVTACNALLCTRPDLWDPAETHITFSELRYDSEHTKKRRAIVKRARRIASRAHNAAHVT